MTEAEAFTVFAQRDDARVELATWRRHAQQFFATELGLAEERSLEPPFPATDAVHVMIAPKNGVNGARLCAARPRTDGDLAAADEAEARVGYAGLTDLAERCRTVWLVRVEEEDDRVALLIAAILASVVLGPILSPRGMALFGVKTARLKLEKPRAP